MTTATATRKCLVPLAPWERVASLFRGRAGRGFGPASRAPVIGKGTLSPALSQRERGIKALLLAAVALLTGCTSPPSVVPLLNVAAEVIEAEAARLDADAQRDRQRVESQRQALADGFAADLRARDTLDTAWVASAAEVYALSREMLVRHEHALDEERRRRQENLDLALDAHRRAIELLQQQDQLVDRITNPTLIERIKPW